MTTKILLTLAAVIVWSFITLLIAALGRIVGAM